MACCHSDDVHRNTTCGLSKGVIVGSVEQWTIDSRFVDPWLAMLSENLSVRVLGALSQLQQRGPQLGRPLVDTVVGSRIHNLKELRPVTNKTHQLRVLFVFDPWRVIVLLAAGDKQGLWRGWYREHIRRAEENYDRYTATL
jgi:hypothetical protein